MKLYTEIKRHKWHFVHKDQNHDLKLFVSNSTLSAEIVEVETWFVEFEYSTHMIGNKQWFECFKETNNGANIYPGDDRAYQIKGYGDIFVTFPDGNIRHIQNAMYIAGIKKNLIYVSMIVDHKLKVEFYKTYCVIKDLPNH